MEKLQVYNFTVVNSTDTTLDVYIDGMILDAETQEFYKEWWGDETSVSFKSIRDQVNASGKRSINFWINSCGGHVGDAMAIHDWIVDLENKGFDITTKGMGMICSAATYILSASKNSSISKNSFYMIHNVSGGIRGDVNVIETYARTMRKFNDTIVQYYANLTGKDQATIEAWMNAETWFTGVEAVDNGFVKKLVGEENFTNSISTDHFPYKNTAALNTYNSFVKPGNRENSNLENLDMNKFVQAIVDAFKAKNLVVTEGGNEQIQLTEENLTNALNDAFKGFDISEMINNHLNEMFKDGLPETIQDALSNSIKNMVNEATKGLPTAEQIKTFENELDAVKKTVAKNAGGAKPKNAGAEGEGEDKGKYNHQGVTWGNQSEEN